MGRCVGWQPGNGKKSKDLHISQAKNSITHVYVLHAGGSDGDAPSREYFECGLWVPDSVGDRRVELWLVACPVFVLLRELRDPDGEGQRARA